MFPRLLDLLSQRGFVLTTLEEAQADPAYSAVPSRANWSGTFLEQMQTSTPAAPSLSPLFERLAGLCAD
jgi:hypothetical protein